MGHGIERLRPIERDDAGGSAPLEHDISLAISDLQGKEWKTLGAIVRVNESDDDLVMYPYLIESQPGQFDVVYSRVVKTINHIRVSSAWVQNHLQTPTAQK